jgi:hypothetical protein
VWYKSSVGLYDRSVGIIQYKTSTVGMVRFKSLVSMRYNGSVGI